MKVYVLTLGFDFEGERVVGVFVSLAKAREQREEARSLPHDSTHIYKMETGKLIEHPTEVADRK